MIASRALHRLSADSQDVDKAASRLYKSEGLLRLRNGIYYKPYTSQYFGSLPPKEKDIIKSIRQQYSAIVSPTGELAAHELGLTHKLPNVIAYNSDKRISPIRLDNHTLHFRKIDSKKLRSVKDPLLMLLEAVAFLLKDGGELNALQLSRIIRLLGHYSPNQIQNAITHWPRWFQLTFQARVKPKSQRYITGLSALNIPYKGKQADWHQIGMLHGNKFHIAGDNYDSAPDTHEEALFDCSSFLEKNSIDVDTHLCATPLQAIKDILYMNIFTRGQNPSFFMLDQFMLDISPIAVLNVISDLEHLANTHQKKLLSQWADENDLN